MWLDGVPCIVKGFTEWPKVGERSFLRRHGIPEFIAVNS
jgi:hypothetical protein